MPTLSHAGKTPFQAQRNIMESIFLGVGSWMSTYKLWNK